MKIDLYQQSGEKKGTLEVSDKMFKAPINDELIRLALLRQMNNARQANAHSKTRGEVRGGGHKPWRQKGTGRARQGSTRSPIWPGGGIAFGPRNTRNYTQRMSKQSRRAALFSILSQKANADSIFALDQFVTEKPSTKSFAALLKKLPAHKSLLVILGAPDFGLEKSAGNIARVKLLKAEYLNPHDLLKYDKIMFLESAVKKAEELFLK